MPLSSDQNSSDPALPQLPDIHGLDGPFAKSSGASSTAHNMAIDPVEDARDPTEVAVGIMPADPPPEGTTDEDDQRLGRTFGGYRLEMKIGQGGMGVVYKGRQVSLDRVVAIKILNKILYENKEFIKRFEREAKSIARINHPNIVAVYDFGVHDGLWFMVNEFVEGSSLAKLIGERIVVPIEEFLPLMVQSLSGLAHVGLSNTVHRDIKPDNILITRDGIAKIADFGLAKDTSDTSDSTDLTAVGLAMGTPAYMSPEQCMGRKLDGRSDQYSMGVTAYFALTGQKPFTGQSSFEIMTRQREHTPPPPHQLNPGVPVEVSEAVMRMLAKEPEGRFPNAEECRQAWIELGERFGVLGSKTRSGEFDALGLRQKSARLNTPPPDALKVDLPPVPMLTQSSANLPPLVVPSVVTEPAVSTQQRTGSNGDLRQSDRRAISGEHRVPTERNRRTPGTDAPSGPPANDSRDSRESRENRAGSERHRGGTGVTCVRCGHLNRSDTTSCVRCGTVLRPGDPATTGRDQASEAQRFADQGLHREAATIWARLADQETDRRQRSVLRAKEREARKADLDRQLSDVATRARNLTERGDLAAALAVLEQGQKLITDTATSTGGSGSLPPLTSELTTVRRRLSTRRRVRILLIITAFLGIAGGGIAAWWFLSRSASGGTSTAEAR